MNIVRLSPNIGAEVTGIDMRIPIDADTRRRLHDAAVEHVALVIRDQSFTPKQFLAAAALFGEPKEQDNPQFMLPGVPFVKKMSNRNLDKNGNRTKVGQRWHTDSTNHELPPKFTILYAVELPDRGGNTNVVNMRAGYESLPAAMKQRIDGMQTCNVRLGSAVTHSFNSNAAIAQAEQRPDPVIHPLVRTNPDNDSRALYFHPNKTENIVGMSPEASQTFLDALMEQAIKPELIYSHEWCLGDMFLWDDRSSMHKVNFDFDQDQHRMMYRTLIRGERPY